MPRIQHFILVILCFFASDVWSQTKNYSVKFAETPFIEAIEQLEKKYDLLFSYAEKDVLGKQITATISAQDIPDLMEQLLQDLPLNYELVNEKFILLTQQEVVGENSESSKGKPSRFCGQVNDEASGLALPYANIYLQGTLQGSASQEDGSFDIQLNLNPTDSLVISYLGYQEQKFLGTEFLKKGCPTIALAYLDNLASMVVVTDYITDGISLDDNGTYASLHPNKISALPGLSEPDVLKTIQFLPGVSSLDGSAANLSIRGSTSDQNLILWEDIPIYHSGHYFGMISAFNPFIIDQVEVYRGGFNAAYGGRIAGLIDLKSKSGISEEATFGAGLNFLNGYIYGDIPLLNKKANVVFSARRSFSELWRSPTFENITRRIHQGVLLQLIDLGKLPEAIRIDDSFRFSDANIKATFQLGKKDEIGIAGLYGENDFAATIMDDRVRRRQVDDLYLENKGLSVNWKRQWSPAFSTRLLGINSDYNYDYNYEVNTINQSTPDKNGIKSSRIKEQQVHLVSSYINKRAQEFQLGAKFINYDVAYEITRASRENGERTTMEQNDTSLQIVYGAFRTAQQKKVGIDASLRFTMLPNDKQKYWEPRLRLWYRPNDFLNIYGSAGKYYQFISQLIEIEGDNASIDTPVWVLAGTKEVPVLNAWQFQLGAVLHKNSWVLDVQGYVKRVNGLSSLSSGFDDDLDDNFLIGEADIRGLDILLKKRWGKYKSWISYSLGKVDYRFDRFFDRDFPAPTDQRHALHWVNSYKHRQWEFSLGWKLNSGRPYSLLENFQLKINPPNTPGPRESIEPVVNEFNSGRLPAHHQMDASIQYTLLPKNTGDWKAVIGFSVFNIYHRNNIYQRDFFIDALPGEQAQLQYSVKSDLGITPNLTLRVEW